MITIRRILCPVDFSDHSTRALDHALAIAAWYDATVTVLHVSPVMPVAAYVSGSGLPAYVTMTADARHALVASMRQLVAREASASTPVEVEVAEDRRGVDGDVALGVDGGAEVLQRERGGGRVLRAGDRRREE